MSYSFSAEGRSAIRSAIVRHADWPEYQAKHNLPNSQSLTVPLINEIGEAMGLDVASYSTDQFVSVDLPSAPEAAPEAAPVAAPVAALAPAALDFDSLVTAALGSAADYVSAKVLDDLRTGISAAVAKVSDFESNKAAQVWQGKVKAARAAAVANGDATKTQADCLGVSSIGKVFNVRGHVATMPVNIWNAEDAPAIDSHYTFDNDTLAVLASNLHRDCAVWLHGPKGTGKTSFAEQYAARTRRDFVRIAFDRWTEPQALRGGWTLKSGSTVWQDGALTAAIRTAGAVILFDEPTIAGPGTMAFLQTLLDKRFMVMPETGEMVPVADGVLFVAADNTQGSGDETGIYSGTGEQNAAFLDRFSVMLPVGFMPVGKECAVLGARLGIDADRVRPFVEFADRSRKAKETDEPIGHRALLAWVQNTLDGVPVKRAFEYAVEAKMRPAYRDFIRELYSAHFDGSAAQAGLLSKAATPETVAFDDASQDAAVLSAAGRDFASVPTDL